MLRARRKYNLGSKASMTAAAKVGRSDKPVLNASFAHETMKRFETMRMRIANLSLRARDRAL